MKLKNMPHAALLTAALLAPTMTLGQTLASLEVVPSDRRLPVIEVIDGASGGSTAPMAGAAERSEETDTNTAQLRSAISRARAMRSPDASPSPSGQSDALNALAERAATQRQVLGNRQRTSGAWLSDVETGVPLRDDIDDNEVWIHISVEEQALVVMRGRDRQETIEYVAFGANGVAPVRRQGSRMTPRGEFRIDHINPHSQYDRFYRIDYPNPAVADKALEEGIINQATRDYIHRYYAQHGRAPMDTPLGGHLGIHGLGNKDAYAHSRTNWTDGCKAVTNEEIRALEPWLALGTRVIIE